MDKPSIFSTVAIIIAITSLVGLGFSYVPSDTPQIQANKDNIDFLIQLAKTHESALVQQSTRSANNTQQIDLLKDYDITISTQVGDIRADIKSKFPQASGVIQQEQTSISTTPFLTLKMEQKDFFLGNTVFFMGTAKPNDAVFITIKDADRGLFQIPISRAEIIDGSWITNYTLRLDDPVGTWQVYARQLSDQTKTLSFTVE